MPYLLILCNGAYIHIYFILRSASYCNYSCQRYNERKNKYYIRTKLHTRSFRNIYNINNDEKMSPRSKITDILSVKEAAKFLVNRFIQASYQMCY